MYCMRHIPVVTVVLRTPPGLIAHLYHSEWQPVSVLPNPRFRRPIGLLLTSAPRLSKPYRYFATFVLLLTYLPRNVLEIGRLCEKLSISCQFRGILNFFNVNEQIYHKLIGLRRHIEPSKSFESDYPQLPEVGQSIVFPPIWVIFG